MTTDGFRAGYIAIVGRPNVGKSTLLNHLVGRKVSIVTPKPQTTRHRVIGIRHRENAQYVFIDTPGLHSRAGKAVNRYLNRTAAGTLADADVVLMVTEALRWTAEDDLVLEKLKQCGNVGLVVNKVDRAKPRDRLLPYLKQVAEKRDFKFMLPVAALTGENIERLDELLRESLPLSEPLYPADQATDQSERFFIAEIIREKLMLRLKEELPYSLAVTVDDFGDENTLVRIAATIWVERDGQKAIVIGRNGAMLKAIGSDARKELEARFGDKVFLQLWVKVREGWSDNERMLKTLGYE